MKDKNYWKQYPVLTTPEEIQLTLTKAHFQSEGKRYELLRFFQASSAENILITPGSGGHAYVFAELAYLLYQQGYNVFIMPKHGGYTITELCRRHTDAVDFIQANYSGSLHLYGEGLGGLVIFYLALAGIPVESIICENAPAILTDRTFQAAMKKDGAAGRRRALLLPLFTILVKLFPFFPVPIKAYLGWKEMIDVADKRNREVEQRLVSAYIGDPDFDKHYPLRAVMSLVSTPPPGPLSTLSVPTMFMLAKRGFIPDYLRWLFNELPVRIKELKEIDGGVFWMVSNPADAAKVIVNWTHAVKQKATYTHSTFNHENN